MKTAHKIYQLISLIFQIPILTIFLLISLLVFNKLSYQNLDWIIVTSIFLTLIPSIYGLFIYFTNRISDENITDRKERVIPFFIITLIYEINLLLTITLKSPEIFKLIAVNYFLLSLIFTIITIFWKISIHVAGITNFVILLTILTNYQALILSPLIILIGWVRIKIKSHNFRQVLGGFLVAALTTFLMTKISF